MEIEVTTKPEKLGEDKKKILYPGARLFILEGGKIQSPDILKIAPKFVSYKEVRVNSSVAKTLEGGREVIMVNGEMQIGQDTVVVNSETKIENKEGQKRTFVTNNEKVAKELSVNSNIIERERLISVKNAVQKMIEMLDEIITADSTELR